MKDYQSVVKLHTDLTEYVRKHNLQPTIMLKSGNSVPKSLDKRIFSFNSGGGTDSHDNKLLIISIEETIGDKAVVACYFYVLKDHESPHYTNYPVTDGQVTPDFSVEELAALLTGLELLLATDTNPQPETANDSTSPTTPRTLH
ncbi:hypothetical protein D3C79_49490 [compost metagenome]